MGARSGGRRQEWTWHSWGASGSSNLLEGTKRGMKLAGRQEPRYIGLCRPRKVDLNKPAFLIVFVPWIFWAASWSLWTSFYKIFVNAKKQRNKRQMRNMKGCGCGGRGTIGVAYPGREEYSTTDTVSSCQHIVKIKSRQTWNWLFIAFKFFSQCIAWNRVTAPITPLQPYLGTFLIKEAHYIKM